ncbi:MAG TPA: leucine-rich repeat domain-containing protein [Bryobacteraceae bacterium]|jgi:internalin A
MTPDERIEEARRLGSTSLDLSGSELTEIPEALTQLTNLQELLLSNNQLKAIPEALGQLTNLRFLNLTSNQLTAIPEAFAQFTKIEHLNLSNNRLTAIPGALAQLIKLRILNLSINRLTSVPEALGQLTSLQILDVSNNQLKAIPEALGRFVLLEHLLLWHNRLTAIPEGLAQLTRLRGLYLNYNRLTSIPEAVARLPNLQFLDLSANRLTAIPEALAQLTNLQSLDLKGNQLTAIPEAVAQLIKLQHLDLGGNLLTAIPEALAQLTNLQSLYLSGNQLTAIPEALAQLTNLQILDLKNNQLKAIPEALAHLTNLQSLDLRDNPLPAEWLAAIRSNQTIEYLRSLAKASENISPRAIKVIFLGEPKSGKTTLREALQGNPHPCDPDRKETVGVDIITIPVQHPTDGQEMYLNVWDFAGQQIEHATHQFFLTEGALYLILWNSRQGADSGKRDVYYWLELLRMRVPNARFLLVATHADRTPPDLPWPDIQRLSGKAFEGHFEVDFEDLEGFDSLRDKILKLAAASSSMNSRWNRKWLAVRDHVRSIKKEVRYQRPAEFRALMAEHGVEDSDAQHALAGELHELGEILYHLDRAELADFVLLDCEWVTELVGLVSRSSQVRANRGILLRADLDAVWQDKQVPFELRTHLLKLMDTFDLSYETKQHDEMAIVVEALPFYAGEPLVEWEAAAGQPELSLMLEFPNLFRRLPPGIPTWGIARGHRFSLKDRKPWRNLALFRYQERSGKSSLGMIQADDLGRKVYVRVRSHHPPYLHAILRDILDDTIRRYPGLEVRESVPCRCQPDCPGSFTLTFLETMQSEGEASVRCPSTAVRQSVIQLLTGMVPSLPFPAQAGSEEIVLKEMRRSFTALRRGQQSFIESTCPNVFQLQPRRDFQTFDNTLEYIRKGESWQLSLYCESDEEWHTAEHSVYDFDLHADWIEGLRKHWNGFAGHMRILAPYLKAAGKLMKTAPGIDFALDLAEKLPDIAADYGPLRNALGDAYSPSNVDIDLRRVLHDLIVKLDAERDPAQQLGGLHKWLNDDGRVLWLCSRHYRPLQSR